MAKHLTQRTIRNKNRYRPKKTPAERRRRERVQRRRLVALGVPEATAAQLDGPTIRRLLRHPAKLKARLGSKQAENA